MKFAKKYKFIYIIQSYRIYDFISINLLLHLFQIKPFSMLIKVLTVMAGGGIGTFLRFGVYRFSYRYFTGNFAWGTLLVNLSGSFIIGLLWGLCEVGNMSSNKRNFLFVGLLGSYTTFSTYTLDSFNYLKDGDYKLALLNIFFHNILGILMVFAGFLAARQIRFISN